MPNPNDEPLVFTKFGNLLVRDLEFFHYWENCEDWIKLTLGYKLKEGSPLGEAGEIVKESHHVYAKKGLVLFPEAGTL